MSNRLDRFEEFMKGSLENHEMPYDASQWASLESKLGTPSGPSWIKWGGIAAAGAVVITAGYFLFRPVEKPIVQQDRSELVLTEQLTEKNNESITENSNVTPSSTDYSESGNTTVSTNNDNENQVTSGTVQNSNSERQVTHATNNSGTGSSTTTSTSTGNSTGSTSSTVTSGNELSKVDPVSTNGLARTIPEMMLNATEICAGEEIRFSALNLPAGASAHWEIQGMEVAEGKTATYKFSEAGNYKIALTYSKGNDKTISSSQNVHVKPVPTAAMHWEEGLSEGRRIVTFTNDSRESAKVMWMFPDGTTSTQNEVSKFFRYKGNHKVQLQATHANGCVATVSKEIFLEEDYNLLAPNAFSPNGDNMNDAFIPAALQVMNKEFTMTVYDRSGKLVYQTRSVGMPWDGRYTSDNMPAPSGTYVWVVTMNGEEPYRGTVTLIRD